jgi:hypothetical protein
MSNGMTRTQARDAAIALAEAAPEQMRALLAPAVPEYVETLLTDMRDHGCATQTGWQYNPAHRTAMQLFPLIMRAVHSADDLLAALLKRLGAGSEGEVAQAVALMRDASEDPDVVADKSARPYLAFYYGANGPGADRPEAAGFRAWLKTVPGSMAVVVSNLEGE